MKDLFRCIKYIRTEVEGGNGVMLKSIDYAMPNHAMSVIAGRATWKNIGLWCSFGGHRRG